MQTNSLSLGAALGVVLCAVLVTGPHASAAAAKDGPATATSATSRTDPDSRDYLTYKSGYTGLDLDDCTPIEASAMEEGPGWAHWQCPGLTKAWPVHVFGDDLRYAVSYGRNGEAERAATQWFGPFNRINTTLEWVLSRGEAGNRRPIATILRFFLHIEQPEGKSYEHPILVVTQLKPGAVCHIAYVDARANKLANLNARSAAYRLAGSYNCDAEPELVGPQTPGVFAE